MRLQINRTWKSRWFSEGKQYKDNLLQDFKLRNMLKEMLAKAGVSSIEIERSENHIHFIITVARPGIVIGRGGSGIDELRDMLQSMINSGIEISTIRILGGTTKSPLWNQMQADIYNRHVETLKTTDAAVVGAAIIAGVGAGIFSDIPEGVTQMVKTDQKYEPIAENVKLYDELYDVFCRMYEGLDEKAVFTSLAKIQERS